MAQAARSTSTTPRKRTSDRPTIHASASILDKQGATPEPFTYVTRAGHRIDWPDPLGLDFEQAETLLADLSGETAQPNSVVLPKWIGDEHYQALRADHLTLRQLSSLIGMVQEHYEAILGDQGEEGASVS